MKRLFLVFGMTVMYLPWLAGAKAQADAIHWSAYGTLPASEGRVVPALPNYPYQFAGILMTAGQYIGNGTGENAVSGTNSGSVLVVQLNGFLATGQQDGATSYQFGGSSSQYQLGLHLTDQASGASGTLTFRGYFSGSLLVELGPGWDSLTNTFVGPTTQSLKLGHDLYTVTIGPVVLPLDFIPLDDPPYGNSGSISASISVQPLTSATPEPSSLLLACLGLPPLGLARWLRRKTPACNV